MARQTGQNGRGGSVTSTPVKPLKILKRPSESATSTPKPAPTTAATTNVSVSSSPQTKPQPTTTAATTTTTAPKRTTSERISYEIGIAVESALKRERERIEKQYLVREQAIVRGLATLISETLPEALRTAAFEQADKLAETLNEITQNKKRPEINAASVRSAFAGSFATEVLPKMQESTRELLRELAIKIDNEVEKKVITPAKESSNVIAEAAQKIAASQYKMKDIIGNNKNYENIRRLLKEESWSEAIGESLNIGMDAMRISLESVVEARVEVGPLVKELQLDGVQMVGIMQIIAEKLEDNTKIRLDWVYEILSGLDEDSGAVISDEQRVACREALLFVIQQLRKFVTNKDVESGTAKHIKFLVHIMKAHVSTM